MHLSIVSDAIMLFIYLSLFCYHHHHHHYYYYYYYCYYYYYYYYYYYHHHYDHHYANDNNYPQQGRWQDRQQLNSSSVQTQCNQSCTQLRLLLSQTVTTPSTQDMFVSYEHVLGKSFTCRM